MSSPTSTTTTTTIITPNTSSTTTESQQPKISISRFAYAEQKLKVNDEEGFKASGILFCQYVNNQLYGLVGVEAWKLEINFLGGKKEETETSYQTGVREFREESGGLITESDAVLIENRMFNNQNSFVVWMDQGKYSLYVILLNPNDDIYPVINNLPQSFQTQATELRDEKGGCYSEMKLLFWMNLSNEISKFNTRDTKTPILDLNGQTIDHPFCRFAESSFRKKVFREALLKLKNESFNVDELIGSLSELNLSAEQYSKQPKPTRQKVNQSTREVKPKEGQSSSSNGSTQNGDDQSKVKTPSTNFKERAPKGNQKGKQKKQQEDKSSNSTKENQSQNTNEIQTPSNKEEEDQKSNKIENEKNSKQ